MLALLETPAAWSALFALVSAVAALTTYRIHRRNLAAKFVDRLYELDKLVIANPLTFDRFVNATSWEEDAIIGIEARKTGEYYKTRSFAYFLINLFDEVCVAYESEHNEASPNDTWTAWRAFILDGAKHPLIGILIREQCICEMIAKRERLRPKPDSAFHPNLLKFLCAVQDEWHGKPFDKKAFW